MFSERTLFVILNVRLQTILLNSDRILVRATIVDWRNSWY